MGPPDVERRHPLELRLPPPLVFLLTTGLILGTSRLTPEDWRVDEGPLAEGLASPLFEGARWTVIAASIGLAVWAIVSFKRAGTTTDPGDPGRATRAVRRPW